MRLPLAAAALTLMGFAFQVRAEACPGIVHKLLKVSGRNDEWTSVDLKTKPTDLVIVVAKGKVKVGQWTGEVEADGANGGIGRLDMKVGTGTVIHVGKKWFGTVGEEGGSVKLRVYDTEYRDNSGTYEVHVMVIPEGIVPPPTVVQAD